MSRTFQSVLDAFVTVQSQWEGYLDFMYTDEIGLVTTGMGNEIDPLSKALALPWSRNTDETPATPDEITKEWQAVKDNHVSGRFDAPYDELMTTLHLKLEDIASLVVEQLLSNEAVLAAFFPQFDQFPADAQMAIHGMAWAMGPGFPHSFPQFTAAANRGSWVEAKAQSKFRLEAPQRLVGHNLMFQNAAIVKANNLDKSILYYPKVAQ
jgi:GH24 family phage-related lysozyme (muramidase)